MRTRRYLKEQREPTVLEMANVVFRKCSDGTYEALKDVHGVLVVGAKYSQKFVEVYAKNKVDVIITRRYE